MSWKTRSPTGEGWPDRPRSAGKNWKRKIRNSYLWTYELYGPISNAFDAGKSITRALENSKYFLLF
jgi:hypothetical protein